MDDICHKCDVKENSNNKIKQRIVKPPQKILKWRVKCIHNFKRIFKTGWNLWLKQTHLWRHKIKLILCYNSKVLWWRYVIKHTYILDYFHNLISEVRLCLYHQAEEWNILYWVHWMEVIYIHTETAQIKSLGTVIYII